MTSDNRRKATELVKKARSLGWRVVEGKHWKLFGPNGKIVVLSKTPSDARSVLNAQAMIRKFSANTARNLQ